MIDTPISTEPQTVPNQHVADVLAGRAGADDAFYRQHVDYVTRVLRAMAQRRPFPDAVRASEGLLDELVKDATTDAIVWGIQNAAKYDPTRSGVRTWLVERGWSVLRKQALAADRRQRSEAKLGEAEFHTNRIPGPEHHLAVQEGIREVSVVLDSLPGKQRQALLLADYFGYGMEEIADVLGLSSSDAASSLTRRARKRFERQWRKARKSAEESASTS